MTLIAQYCNDISGEAAVCPVNTGRPTSDCQKHQSDNGGKESALARILIGDIHQPRRSCARFLLWWSKSKPRALCDLERTRTGGAVAVVTPRRHFLTRALREGGELHDRLLAAKCRDVLGEDSSPEGSVCACSAIGLSLASASMAAVCERRLEFMMLSPLRVGEGPFMTPQLRKAIQSSC